MATRMSDESRWQRRQDAHYLLCAPPKVNRWGVPLYQWRTMTTQEQQEEIGYQLHPRREGRDELVDHRREGRDVWRPLVRE